MTSMTGPEPPLASPSNELAGESPLYQQGSCATCRRRKVKCDKLPFCSNCRRLGLQCEYAPRKRAPRQPRKPDNLSTREVELIKRLNKLESNGQVHEKEEAVVKKSEHPDGEHKDTQSPRLEAGLGLAGEHGDGLSPPLANSMVPPLEKDFGTLVISEQGASRYVNHNFWARVTEEVDDLVQLVFEDYKEEEDDESSPETQDYTPPENDHQSFVFGYSSSTVELRQLHPLPSQLPFYFQVYVERVDPLIKMLHKPSLEKMMKESADDLGAVSKSEEALLFGIYFAVIASMTADEVRINFASEKKFIQDRYCFGLEQALARANFLDSADLITLQAFVLYLTIIRCQSDSRVGWALSRSATAVAQSLGLHRDGTHFGLPPFECEIRRRLWWQLCVLDFRNSEKHGTEPSIVAGTYDTHLPANINDADLLPNATAPPESRIGITEMTITLIACELTSAVFTLQQARNNNAPLSSIIGSTARGKDTIIQEFCQHLQNTYVRHCTDDSPTSWVVKNMCQLLIYKMESILLLPLSQAVSRPAVANEASDQIFIKSIMIVEIRRNLEIEKTKQWHWYIRTILQWHAIAYLLSELCVREPDDNVTRAWNILDTVFQDWRNFRAQGAPGVLWLPMKKLLARARHKRETDLKVVREGDAAKQATQESVKQESTTLAEDTKANFETNVLGNNQNVPYMGIGGYQGGYPEQWLQVQPYRAGTPTPWLLEDSAMQDLGLDMNAFDPNMQWEGVDDLMQDLHSSLVQGPDTMTNSLGGWDPLW
ncbi:hypothetical protein N431DRAFT_505180 [Stipitochalara longipes BDJ]|nr:hypothetical protein N431DRAFT_505180 [Stipitochalara longipes BDJ]